MFSASETSISKFENVTTNPVITFLAERDKIIYMYDRILRNKTGENEQFKNHYVYILSKKYINYL